MKMKKNGFTLAEIMLPHMIRSAKQKLKKIKIKKLKTLSKKIAKSKK